MKKKFMFLSISLLLVLVISATNQEWFLQEEEEDLVSGKVISISASALKPANSSEYALPWYAGEYATTDFYGNINMYAPVNLPHGATVVKVAVYVFDNTASGNLEVSLLARKLNSFQNIEMSKITTSLLSFDPNIQHIKDTTINQSLVQNHYYAYYLKVRFEGDGQLLQFYGAKIIYE